MRTHTKTSTVRNQLLRLSAVSVIVVLAACGDTTPTSNPSASSSTEAPSQETVTLRMAATGGTFDPQASHLIDSIAATSSGQLMIEPADEWDVTGTHQDVEREIIEAVAAGDLDLGLVGTRSLSALGISDFDALIAPMLIDSYPLERAVLDSDIPSQMLPALDQLGVTGLSIIGGHLRYPAGSDDPFLGPETYADRTVHVFRSEIGTSTIAALGATASDVAPDERDVGLADGSIHGLENSMLFLADRPAFARHITINAALWPATGIIVASPETIADLDEQQMEGLMKAVADTEAQALEVLGDDQDYVQSVCDQGGSVYQASAAELEALIEAVQPVYDPLMADPNTGAYIEQIRGLKESIEVQPLAIPEECGGAAEGGDARLPEGTYKTDVLTDDDVIAALESRGLGQDVIDAFLASDSAGREYRITYTFENGSFVQLESFGDVAEVGSTGTYRVIDDTHLEFTEPCCGTAPFQFSFDGGTLVLHLDIPDEDIQDFCANEPIECIGGLRVLETGPLMLVEESS